MKHLKPLSATSNFLITSHIYRKQFPIPFLTHLAGRKNHLVNLIIPKLLFTS